MHGPESREGREAGDTRRHAEPILRVPGSADDVAADDVNLAFFTTEIEQIENEVIALESDEDTSESDSTIAELEMELIVISSDFWKE